MIRGLTDMKYTKKVIQSKTKRNEWWLRRFARYIGVSCISELQWPSSSLYPLPLLAVSGFTVAVILLSLSRLLFVCQRSQAALKMYISSERFDEGPGSIECGGLSCKASNFSACHSRSVAGHRCAQQDLLIGGC